MSLVGVTWAQVVPGKPRNPPKTARSGERGAEKVSPDDFAQNAKEFDEIEWRESGSPRFRIGKFAKIGLDSHNAPRIKGLRASRFFGCFRPFPTVFGFCQRDVTRNVTWFALFANTIIVTPAEILPRMGGAACARGRVLRRQNSRSNRHVRAGVHDDFVGVVSAPSQGRDDRTGEIFIPPRNT